MKLTNKTEWDTRDLRKLITTTCKREGVTLDRTVIIAPSRHDYHGRARYHLNWIRMTVPPPKQGGFNVYKFTRILIHEIGHNQGLHHKDMVDWGAIDVLWCQEFSVRPKEKKPRPRRDLRLERYEKAVKKVQEYETKSKRITTLLKKWRKKVRYYEKTEKEGLNYDY